MIRFFLLFIVQIILIDVGAEAGTLQGKVTDEQGEPLPFTNIFVQNSTNGTNANELGFYQFRLPAGTYEIVFKYIGFKPQVHTLTIGEGTLNFDVKLKPEAYSLQEVVVKASAKDPAYAMVKAAINRRKFHLKETEAYKCRVYIKNLQRLTEVPKKVMGLVKVTDLKPGIVYLSESVSELSFKQPDKYREKILSSKVSGSNKTLSFNQATDFEFNFYQNLIKVEGLTPRGFVSPLAANAFLFYKFELMGSTQESGQTIHKIKVTPLRKNDPAFKGFIYLVAGDWRLQSLDLSLNKNTQLEFVDSVQMKQVFAPVGNSGIWLPISKKLTLRFSGLGFKGNGYVNVIYSQYQAQPASFVKAYELAKATENAMVPDEKTAEPEETRETKTVALPAKKVKRKQKQELKKEPEPEPLFDKKHFNNEILAADKAASEKDSSYWEEIRPVPLTEEEISDYKTKDSLQAIVESKPYKDSIDRLRNQPGFGNLFFNDYTYQNSFRRRFIIVDPLLAVLQYN